MSKWQEKRLGEIAEINPESISNKNYYDNISYIDISSVKEGILYGVCNYSMNNAPDRAKRILRNNDIIISTVRPNLKAYYFVKNDMPNLICSTGFAVLRAKNTTVSRFLYYVISNDSFINYLSLVAKGSAYPAVDKKDFINAKINIPDLATQEKIADILSTYDDLIENNNRRIEILEQMAQEIYKEWFVRFRFPGHEKVKFVSSKLGKLPQTFNVVNAETVFEFYIGGGWGNENISENFPIEANVIRGTDIPNIRKYDISTCPVRYHKISNYKSRQLVSGDIVMEISGGTADQPVGRCALITQELIDRFKNGNVICASFCKLIRLNKNLISPYFCYYWLQYLYDTRIIDRFQLQSTGIINFKFEAFLKKGLIMLPPMDIMHQFENYVKYIVQEINMLASQNQNLIKQRDLLLPRLMSGKLEV